LVFAASRREGQVMLLMTDAARVIEMRLRMIALGQSSPNEMFLMFSEKMNAVEEAKAIFVRSGNASLVIENYERIVAAKWHDCQPFKV
jgi:hypothetical protein